MAYVYSHIRLDSNKIFYIGIGSDVNYGRANKKQGRTKHWNNVVSKTQYRVEIILENISWSEACYAERYLIKMYGRADLGLGSLVNMTDGGEGVNGYWSEEMKVKLKYNRSLSTREKMSKSKVGKKGNAFGKKRSIEANIKTGEKLKGRKLSDETKKKIGESKKGHPGYKKGYPIVQCDLNDNIIKEWSSIREASRTLKIDDGGIVQCLKGRIKTSYKFKWKYKLL